MKNAWKRAAFRCALTASLVFSMVCADAWAAAPTYPKPVLMLQSSGFEIGKSFDAGHGLTGWIITRNGESHVVFTTADREAMLIGNMTDGSGKDLTQAFVDKYTARPDWSAAYEELGHAHFIDEGAPTPGTTPRRVVYIIFDPNCPYCHIAWQTIRPYVSTGLEVRWVPVAYLKPSSDGKAASILNAANPVQALSTNEQGFNDQTHEGAIATLLPVPDAIAKDLKRNDDLMRRFDSTATPTWIWKDERGQVHTVVGLPQPERMLDILGISKP